MDARTAGCHFFAREIRRRFCGGGSGKTAVLTRRIIERVCAPDGSGDLSRILVVTFTKAAASELVSRISDALADELAKHPENRHIYSQSLLVSSAHISTIHSFCLELIRTNFQKLGVPADFSAADETEITLMMKRLADELISDYFEGEISPDEEKIEDFARFADTFGDISNMEKLSETMLSLYRSLSSTSGFLDNIDRFRLAYEKAAADGFDGSVWERRSAPILRIFSAIIKRYTCRYLHTLRQTICMRNIPMHFRMTCLMWKDCCIWRKTAAPIKRCRRRSLHIRRSSLPRCAVSPAMRR